MANGKIFFGSVLSVVTPRDLVDGYQRFGGTYRSIFRTDTILRNVGNKLKDHTASQAIRQYRHTHCRENLNSQKNISLNIKPNILTKLIQTSFF
jgi:hypothetical protein